MVRSTRALVIVSLLVAATCAGGAGEPGAAATAPAAGAAFTIVPCREDRVRLGRMLVTFPNGAKTDNTRINVFKMAEPDKQIAGAYGKLEEDLVPGRYRVTVGGAAVDDVEVKSKHDTLVHVGALSVKADENARVDVLGPDEKPIAGGYGNFAVGLPVGAYKARVGGQVKPVTIEKDKVTDG